MDKKQLRSTIFQHLDGLVTAPIVSALNSKNIFAAFTSENELTLDILAQTYQANKGYLNVALRTLASQGFIDYRVDNKENAVFVSVNSNTKAFIENAYLYDEVSEFLKYSINFHPRNFDKQPFDKLALLFKKSYSNFDITFSENENELRIQKQILKHIEGHLVGPTIVRLGMSGMFHKYFMESSFKAEEFHTEPECFETILDFLTHLDWFEKKKDNYQFTETGLFFAKRAASYGVTVSYLPMFSKMEDLLFGDAERIRQLNEGEDEIHVDRAMNVWGSGGAHATYFKVIDSFIVEIFNQPLDSQPKGILDMGCGNGAFLQHLYETIERYTLRGKHLDEYPLFLVGADYNQAALKITRANLIKNDIWAKVIWGDIGDPERLAEDLKENYGIALEDLLNMRTFLDHNRIWFEPKNTNPERVSTSTGAFAHRGVYLSNNLVEENLLEHLQKWQPYIKKFGLMVVELHTIDPAITSKHLGETPATAYDATHGFSDQYIVEVDVFHRVCKEAGLQPDEKLFKKFPNSELATVSINLLK